MLIREDDYPIHQTPEPLAHTATADRNFYDRFFFNGYSRDGSIFFAGALGLYPNRRVMDAAFNVMVDGKQYVLSASRYMLGERCDIVCGPIRVVIDEPMRRLRLIVDENEHGISADLTFAARSAPLEEPRFIHRVDHQVLMDCTRMTQFGAWTGSIRMGDDTLEIAASDVLGCRDRSWGIRGLGPREEGAPIGEPQFFWLWAPINFDDVCVHFDVNEDAEGRRWHWNGVMADVLETDAVEPTDTSSVERMREVDHAIEWVPGTRRARRAELVLTPHRAEPIRLELEPLSTFQMSGLGYLSLEWGHGFWKGHEALGSEVIDLSKVDPLHPTWLHVQQLCRVRMGEREGLGVFEQLAVGPHLPSGFASIFDGAA